MERKQTDSTDKGNIKDLIVGNAVSFVRGVSSAFRGLEVDTQVLLAVGGIAYIVVIFSERI